MTTQTPARPVASPQAPAPALDAPRKRLFTRKEYHAMGKAGVFEHKERVELLEGEIIVMSPVGNRHAFCVDRLNYEFADLNISKRAIVRVQNPAATSPTSEPEPDLMLMAYKDDRYVSGHPSPQDILLLVEVADSSLNYDTNVKLRHYAQVGVREVWIADLRNDRVISHTEPSPQGYLVSRIYRPGDTISPTAFPDLKIAVSDIIPARPNPEPDTQNGDDNDNSEQ